MPFKTRAHKTKASIKWAQLVEGGQVSYGVGQSGAGESVVDDSRGKEISQASTFRAADKFNIKNELVKIILLASMIIGLQIILKISHIGF